MSALSINEDNVEARFASLSRREREVLDGLLSGLSNKRIGEKLGISRRTVEVHRAQLMRKTQAKNFAQLVRMAFQAGIQPVNGET